MAIKWATYPDGTPILRWHVLKAGGDSEIQDHRQFPVHRVKAWRSPNEDQAEPAIRGERAVRLDHRMMLMADLTNKDHFHVRIAPGEWLVGALHWPNLKADKQAFHDHR